MGAEQSHIAQNWRIKDERYSLTTKITVEEARVFSQLGIPLRLGMNREQLQNKYPLAFEIVEASTNPTPKLLARIRERIDQLRTDLRPRALALAVAMIATFA